MAYNILLTSLYAGGSAGRTVGYYYCKEDGKFRCCDAMLTVEASAKYVLANYPVDEIVTIGRRLTFDEGDDRRLIELREGKSFYTSDIGDLSTYSLFRYRIAQYIDELKIEQRDLMELLSPEEQESVADFLKQYYRGMDSDDEYRKYNRFFAELAEDKSAYEDLRSALAEEFPAFREDPDRFHQWVRNYLYTELRDSYKLELLRGNETVGVRFVPTNLSLGGKLPVDNMLEIVRAIVGDHEEVNLYVALNNDDQMDNFVLLNILDIVDTLSGDRVTVRKVLNTTSADDGLAGMILDDTVGYGITELVAAARAFLQYGKVDMIVDYWEKTGAHNEEVEKMIYAMRHIDFGISLCNIGEIENGIEQLREIYAGGVDFGSDDYYCKLFTIIAEGIRLDYGPLLEGDKIGFIDLVRWAFGKKFYQQTLTIIESKAPGMFVGNGIFYYCSSEEEREFVLRALAEERRQMRPFEYWKMDDIDHYFIKNYVRKSNTNKGGGDSQLAYAKFRVKGLDSTSTDRLRCYTCCDDRDALTDLLYAYYHIGEIRNATNHAEENVNSGGRLIVDRKDIPFRMSQIRESIQFFLNCYDKVMDLIKDKHPTVCRVTGSEVRAYANKYDNRDGSRDNNRDNNRESKSAAAPSAGGNDSGAAPADSGRNNDKK